MLRPSLNHGTLLNDDDDELTKLDNDLRKKIADGAASSWNDKYGGRQYQFFRVLY